MADDRGAVWTARIRDAKQILNELRCVSPLSLVHASVSRSRQHARFCLTSNTLERPSSVARLSATPGPSGLMDEKDRVRFIALQRRKLQRFDDIVDDLEDLMTDGSPSSAELEARRDVIGEFREDVRRLNATFAGGTPSVVVEEPPETVLGKLDNIAGSVKSEAARVTGEVNAAVAGAASTATAAQKKQDEAAAVRGLSSQELLQLQRSQMRKQDDALDQLDSMVGKLKMTSDMIRKEVDVQARMVEDLDKDFSHTQSRMKKLRKQGFKLAGEKNGEDQEKLERAEAMKEMKKNLPSHQRELAQQKQQNLGGECVVM